MSTNIDAYTLTANSQAHYTTSKSNEDINSRRLDTKNKRTVTALIVQKNPSTCPIFLFVLITYVGDVWTANSLAARNLELCTHVQ